MAIHQKEIRLGRAMTPRERKAFGLGFRSDCVGDRAFLRAMGLPEKAGR